MVAGLSGLPESLLLVMGSATVLVLWATVLVRTQGRSSVLVLHLVVVAEVADEVVTTAVVAVGSATVLVL